MFERERVNQACRQAPQRQGNTAPGVAFFADFLWRSKESQRGALPHSATASRGVPWVEVSAQALAIPIFKVSQGTCHEVLYPRGFRSISPTGKELKKCGGESAGASPKSGGLKPAYLGPLQRGCSEALVNRASSGTLPASPLFIRLPEVLARRPFIRAGFEASPRQGENWKNVGAEAQAHLQKEVA